MKKKRDRKKQHMLKRLRRCDIKTIQATHIKNQENDTDSESRLFHQPTMAHHVKKNNIKTPLINFSSMRSICHVKAKTNSIREKQ
jgi:hypothetical protein